jgi:hypothetical protein
MPWKKSEPMDQRIEFALQALRTDNFRTLCAQYASGHFQPTGLAFDNMGKLLFRKLKHRDDTRS